MEQHSRTLVRVCALYNLCRGPMCSDRAGVSRITLQVVSRLPRSFFGGGRSPNKTKRSSDFCGRFRSPESRELVV